MTGEPGTEIVEAEAQELAPAASPPATLFRTDDPVEVIRRATAVAETLKDVLLKQDLITRIRDREHVRVEGWTLCGTMLGVFPVTVWSRKLDDGWEARVEARTLTGAVVGAAEAECLRAEKEWGPNPTRGRPRDDYALRSMAQTRATSKALRQPLGFIMQLAGFDPTPAEEMPREDARVEGGLKPYPVPRSWVKVREAMDKDGGSDDAWPLFDLFLRAASYHQFGEVESAKLTKEQRAVMLQKAAGAVCWIMDNPNTPMGVTPSVEHWRAGWAHVLDGHQLEIPDYEMKSIAKEPAPDPDLEAERLADEAFADDSNPYP